MNTGNGKFGVSYVSFEEGCEIVDALDGKVEHTSPESSALTTFSGTHPDLGEVTVVFPPWGKTLVLPFASQKAVL